MSSFESALGQLPEPLLDKLRSMIRRVRRLLFVRGFFATLTVALASLLAIMAIDATVTLFSTTARWALSLAGLAATLTAAWWFLARPLSRRFTLTEMARILETRHPELQERISTAVELLASDDPESIRGSAELIEAVVDSAVVDAAAVDPKSEFTSGGRSKKFILATAAGGGLIAVLFLLWPTQSWTLFARAIAPFLDIGNAYADTLVIDPGHTRVARGEAVTIQVSIRHQRIQRAEMRRRLPDGTEVVERMALIAGEEDGTKRFSLTIPSVDEGFDYRIRAGAALSQYYGVVAVDPPSLETLDVRYDHPDYTGLPDVVSDAASGEIRAVAHTRVTVAATLDKPAAMAKMLLNQTTAIGQPVIEENRVTWDFALAPEMRGNWHLEIADGEGFSHEETARPMDALPDKAPIVRITRPTQPELRLKPTEPLPIEIEVVEDFGFGDVTLLVTPDGVGTPLEVPQSAPTTTDRAETHTARALLDVAALPLAPEQRRLAVQVRVRDNRPADYDGPGVGLSEVFFVTLDEKAPSLADQAIEAQRKGVTRQIDESKKELQRARDAMRRTEQELNRSEEFNDKAREKLSDFTEHNETARATLAEIAAVLDTPLFQEASRQAETLATESLAQAQESADLVPVTDDKDERLAEATAAREKIEESIRDLDQLALTMREAEEDYRAISRLSALADRQQELARKAGEWSERAKREAAELTGDPANNDAEQFSQRQQREAEQFRKEQSRVERQLGEMLKDNNAALSEVLAEQRDQSESLAREARALAREQEALGEASRSATERDSDQENALREALLDQIRENQDRLAEAAQEAQEADAEPPSGLPNDLARRREALARQIEAVENGTLQEALSRMESQLDAEADALARETKHLAQSLRNLQQNQATSRSDEAGKELTQGAREAAESARRFTRAQEQQTDAERKGELTDGQLASPARATMLQGQRNQAQAARSLAEAARALVRSAEDIGQTMEGLEPAEADERLASKEELAEGFDEVSKSTRSQNADEAANRSQTAADSLQQLARTAMKKMDASPKGQPAPSENPGGEPDTAALNESGKKTGDQDGDGLPPELRDLGISAADWARFKGALAGGNASAIETELPAEYRELVGRYFQVIAREAGKKK